MIRKSQGIKYETNKLISEDMVGLYLRMLGKVGLLEWIPYV